MFRMFGTFVSSEKIFFPFCNAHKRTSHNCTQKYFGKLKCWNVNKYIHDGYLCTKNELLIPNIINLKKKPIVPIIPIQNDAYPNDSMKNSLKIDNKNRIIHKFFELSGILNCHCWFLEHRTSNIKYLWALRSVWQIHINEKCIQKSIYDVNSIHCHWRLNIYWIDARFNGSFN